MRAETTDVLNHLAVAARSASSRVLVITVVNGRDGDSESIHAANRMLIAALCKRAETVDHLSSDPPTLLVRWRDLDVLALDHSSEGCRFRTDEGVGTARRIGCDLALRLYAANVVSSPWIRTTDADAMPSERYFCIDDSRWPSDTVAFTYPFWHSSCHDSRVDRATALYEVRLRYWLLGLHWAGSPYALHSLGSCLGLHAWGYAAVRGMPTRLAGEDFHLVRKLVKVGRIVTLDTPLLPIRARASDRAPFGTGNAVADIIGKLDTPEQLRLWHPATFAWLRDWLARLERFSETRDARMLHDEHESQQLSELTRFDGDARAPLLRGASSQRAVRRRIDQWFDGLRTLRAIHILGRSSPWAPLCWKDALRRAPFIAFQGDLDSLEAVRRHLFELESLANDTRCASGRSETRWRDR